VNKGELDMASEQRKKKLYAPFVLNANHIMQAKRGMKIVDGKALVLRAEDHAKLYQEIAAAKDALKE
jgi:hypothetical protein